MLSRGDFIFTIGYDGPSAVVDVKAKRKYGKLNTQELLDKGLFRAAYASALYSKDIGELRGVIEAFNKLGGEAPVNISAADLAAFEALCNSADSAEGAPNEISTLDRLFGAFFVEVKRTVYL